MSSSYVYLNQALCADPAQAGEREWLLTNGIGGYASGTVAGLLSRRYHGLLVAPVHPPLGRYLLIVKADAVLIDSGLKVPLHTNRWRGGVIEPMGLEYTESFRLDHNMPVWRYAVGDLRIEQRIWMDHGLNQTRVGFRWIDGERTKSPMLRLGLIASWRDHHAVNQPGGFNLDAVLAQDGLRLNLPGGRFVEIEAPAGRFTLDTAWIENFLLAREQERGLEEIDHHPRVAYLDLPIERGAWTGISLSLGRLRQPDLIVSLSAERTRAASLTEAAPPGLEGPEIPDWVSQLIVATDSYLFLRDLPDGSRRRSVIAGYPWFGDWGRDTMIALPGLTLVTGRYRQAREILQTFAGYVSRGMLPNVFPGGGAVPEYNTVDAALWYIEAWRAYLEASADIEALEGVLPVLTEIIHAYRDGTRYGIGMDPDDGLIKAGVPGQQLTWMDARVNGREITPRQGKPVEINALWYNALRSMSEFCRILGRPPREFEHLAETARTGFLRFRRGKGAGLYDVLDGPNGADASIRPNQIFAVSLVHSPLDSPAQRRDLVAECQAHLLTPFGLRSLSPLDPQYRGRYRGGVAERDGAYHQGPVWAWLLGHFALAEYSVTGNAVDARQRLAKMADHLLQAGLGQISEIFDGDPPHTPRGAPAQAWSVACTLEAWWRLTRVLRHEAESR